MLGAQQLGMARGSIQIDTSDLRNTVGIARSVSGEVARSFGAIDASAKRTQAVMLGVSRAIGGLRTELTGLSIGAGIITGLGIKTAASFQEAGVKLAGMVGGIDKATALMEDLRAKARAAGLPFQDMLDTAIRLLPTFQGNSKELERWYGIIRRTAVLNATEGMTGAAFSINEAITSGGTDLVSLVERFNISRVGLRAELAKNGNDMYDALDKVLTRMGITDETARNMGQTFNASFRAAKDAALQLLAEGFTPLLQALTPILQAGAQWLSQLRESNPLVAQLGAGLATAAVTGAPLLLLFNQLVEAGTKLKALGVLGGLGRVAGAGLAVGAGVGLGIGATNAIGNATGNQQMANAGLSDLIQVLRKLIANIGWTFMEIDRLIRTSLLSALHSFVNAVISAASAIGGVVSAIANMLPGAMGGNALGKIGADLTAGGAGLQATSDRMFNGMIADINRRTQSQMRSFIEFMVPGTFNRPSAAGGGGGGMPAGPDNSARNKIIFQWAKDVERLERDAAKARLDVVRDYERSVAATIAQYNKSALREEEDFQRSRARAIAEYNRSVAEAIAQAARRESDWQADYNEKIAEMRSDANERLVKLEEDYNEARERAERDHKDRLMEAAARLDAVAVRNEQRNYERQRADAEDAYNDQRSEIQTALDEREADELRSHQKRLEQAREADAERLADMQKAFEEQTAQEDFERAIRLQRQAEDHAEQLAEMARAQEERLQQISEQAALEKQALNDAFIEQLNQAGVHRDAWLELQKKQQDEALKLFGQFWAQFNQQFPNTPGPVQGPVNGFPSGWQDFGYGGDTVAAQAAAAGGSSTSRSISIAQGAIVINAAAGQSEEEIGRIVERRMMGLLEEVSH